MWKDSGKAYNEKSAHMSLESLGDDARILYVVVGVDGDKSGNWSGDLSQFWMPGEYSRKYAKAFLPYLSRPLHHRISKMISLFLFSTIT